MSKLTKKSVSAFNLEQTGSVFTFIVPACLPVDVEKKDLISYVEDYELHSTDITGGELYDHLSAEDYFDQNEDKVCGLYFNKFILSNLKFLKIEKLDYNESVKIRRVA